MFKSGLVSITFRNLPVKKIIDMVAKAELDSIEWGGDIHVPHGDTATAKTIYKQCHHLGISCNSYGSYYRVGSYASPKEEFTAVLASAATLESEVIRVWAGTKSSKETDNRYRELVAKELSLICNLALKEGIKVALEFHSGTLTDTAEEALHLITSTDSVNLYTYWQPPSDRSVEGNLQDIQLLGESIYNIHVFTWDKYKRLALEEGYNDWIQYLKFINSGKKRYCMLEFIKDNSIQGFYKDAKVLKGLINEVNSYE